MPYEPWQNYEYDDSHCGGICHICGAVVDQYYVREHDKFHAEIARLSNLNPTLRLGN